MIFVTEPKFALCSLLPQVHPWQSLVLRSEAVDKEEAGMSPGHGEERWLWPAYFLFSHLPLPDLVVSALCES